MIISSTPHTANPIVMTMNALLTFSTTVLKVFGRPGMFGTPYMMIMAGITWRMFVMTCVGSCLNV
ncbi:hypothetical protein D3C71_2146550 [compost metagenome]